MGWGGEGVGGEADRKGKEVISGWFGFSGYYCFLSPHGGVHDGMIAIFSEKVHGVLVR